jgi:hypothetical protein
MVSFLLGQRANTIGEVQRLGKVREAKDSLEPLDAVAFDQRPFRDLRLELPNVGLGHARRVAPAGATPFINQSACQRRLNVDPPMCEIAEAKLTHASAADQGEREGDLPPRRSV